MLERITERGLLHRFLRLFLCGVLCSFVLGCFVFGSSVLSGCGKGDRALVIPFSEEGEGQGTEQETGQGTGQETGQGTGQETGQGTESEKEGENAIPSEPAIIYVHVCGAVKSPGVVSLLMGSRGQDALQAAGGFLEDADRDAINLAGELQDGQKLYFPFQGEDVPPENSQNGEEDGFSNGLVNINTAGEETLCTLPGIGTSRAKAIIEYREKQGKFSKIEDLMKVSGIKTAAYDKIKDLITVR